LLLREDNADLRLTPAGRELGLVDDERWALFEAKRRMSDLEVARLKALRLRPADVPALWTQRVLGAPLAREVCAFELLRRPGVTYEALLEIAAPPAGAGARGSHERIRRAAHARLEAKRLARVRGARPGHRALAAAHRRPTLADLPLQQGHHRRHRGSGVRVQAAVRALRRLRGRGS